MKLAKEISEEPVIATSFLIDTFDEICKRKRYCCEFIYFYHA